MTNEVKENTPLLNTIGLKKYYSVKKGLFSGVWHFTLREPIWCN